MHMVLPTHLTTDITENENENYNYINFRLMCGIPMTSSGKTENKYLKAHMYILLTY